MKDQVEKIFYEIIARLREVKEHIKPFNNTQDKLVRFFFCN